MAPGLGECILPGLPRALLASRSGAGRAAGGTMGEGLEVEESSTVFWPFATGCGTSLISLSSPVAGKVCCGDSVRVTS